ncbi:hypothetical protein DNF11_3825 [Malassezia restricta CBS 7877]|uniref:Uncharacterized protein n=1 Tax=Malassezia restricta (strain ATCC 96810 / NBRC 103918 / CBS 7877) TaxID=425264 RepID=A0A3G2S9L0_MALR7|nr:hypothetical protein DNF11_3825 [Malassezia restricta CBS 7877]
MAGPVRVRVRSAHPLPPAQFWVVIDRADDIDVVRERIARILQTRYDAPVTATALCLSVLDFEVWDCVGDVLQDDGLVTVSMIKRRKVCEAPSENTDMVVHPDAERQIMAEAHKISLLMRSECGVQPRKTLGVKRKKPEASRFVHDISQDLEQAELEEEPDELDYEDEVDYDDVMDENEVIDEVDYDDVVDDHDELEEVVRAKDEDENQENDEEENEGEREEEESEESEDEEEESEEEEGGDEESEEEESEEEDEEEESEEEDEEGESKEEDDGESEVEDNEEESEESQEEEERKDEDDGGDDEQGDSEPSVYSSSIPSVWVPPGQGKDRTRHKNQKRRERRKAARNTQFALDHQGSMSCPRPATDVRVDAAPHLPPGGGSLDITSSTPETSPLESIAQRMLERTTVGHRKRRKRNQELALPSIHTPAFVSASDVLKAHQPEDPPKLMPIPSKLAPEELPANVSVTSTDCEQWYYEQPYYQNEEDDDASTQAYYDMQRQVRASLEQEKQQEDVQDSVLDEEHDPLRDSLPRSFGRSSDHRHDEGAPRHPILDRIQAIRASIYGA